MHGIVYKVCKIPSVHNIGYSCTDGTLFQCFMVISATIYTRNKHFMHRCSYHVLSLSNNNGTLRSPWHLRPWFIRSYISFILKNHRTTKH